MDFREINRDVAHNKVKKLSKLFLPLTKELEKKFNYVLPGGYPKWSLILRVFALQMLVDVEYPSQDLIQKECAAAYQAYVEDNSPVYCLNKDLLNAFLNSTIKDYSKVVAALKPPLKSLLVVLPEKTVKTPDGNYLDHFVILIRTFEDHIRYNSEHPEEKILEVPANKNSRLKIVVVAEDTGTCNWKRIFGISHDNKVSFDGGTQYGVPFIAHNDDTKFIDQLQDLALQVLLILCTKPEYSQEVESKDLPSHAQRNKHIRKPRWLGHDYKVKSTNNIKETSGESRYNVDFWWRIGHWRLQAIGKRGEANHKIIWIEPTIVVPH